MSRAARIVAGATILSALAFVPLTGSAQVTMPLGLVLHQGTPAQAELVAWAEARFRMAGLEPPATEIRFHDDLETCRMRLGVYWGAGKGLDMCTGEDAGTMERKTMLHELAHAWIGENVSTEQRDAFMALRGVERWNSRDDAWEDRGTEHAAEILAWGLMDDRISMFRFSPSAPDDLAGAFEFLTGLSPVLRDGDVEVEVEDPLLRAYGG